MTPVEIFIKYISIVILVVAVVFVGSYLVLHFLLPYQYNSQASLTAFQASYRHHQQICLALLKDVLAFTSPEKRDAVATEFVEQTNVVLACRYLRLGYIEEYMSCITLLHRALSIHEQVIQFAWDDSEIFGSSSEVDSKTKAIQKLYDVYGNHAMLTANGIPKMIRNEEIDEKLELEESVVDFFRLWSVHIESRSDFVVYEYDSNNPDLYQFVLMPRSKTVDWDEATAQLGSGNYFRRFLLKPEDDGSPANDEVFVADRKTKILD